MSVKSHFEDGIIFDADHGGLLSLDEERLIHLIKKEPIANVYHVEQTPFARGKFAAVRRCTHQQTGVAYAAKFIRKRRRAMDQRRDIVHEIAVLRLAADNRRIVRLHEVYETPAEMALVLELAAGGELQAVLDVQDGLQEDKAVIFMRQILEGLGFLHDRNIAHLDLKPQNLLLTGAYPDCDVKLCDFGISRVVQSGVEVREILGTPDYVAPEILSYEPITLATDMWSVGVLAYVLLSGFSPFAGDTKQETFLNVSQCALTFPEELFGEVSAQAVDFVRATLQVEPRKRLTARQCLQHPWLERVGAVVHLSRDVVCTVRQNHANEELTSSGRLEAGQTPCDNASDHLVDVDMRASPLEKTADLGNHVNGESTYASAQSIAHSGLPNGCRRNHEDVKFADTHLIQHSDTLATNSPSQIDDDGVEVDLCERRVSGLVTSTRAVHIEVADFKERRPGSDPDDLPANKRARSCECCLAYPAAQCCAERPAIC